MISWAAALKRMNFAHFTYLYLWIAPHLLLVAVAVLMLRRKLYKEFPIFFVYLLFDFLQFCFLFATHLLFTTHSFAISASVYGKIDIFSRAGDIALHFGILQELFESPLVHNVPLRRTMGRMVNWVTLFLVVLASVFIGSLYFSTLGHRLFPAYMTIEALNTAQCGLLVLVFLWYRFLRLRMSPFVFGIAVGIGLVWGLEPVIHAWKDSLVAPNSFIPDIVQMATYHCAVLIWLYFAHAREKTAANSKTVSLFHAREWAADLGRVIHL